MQVNASFGMNTDNVGAGLPEPFNITVGVDDHKVNIERLEGSLSDLFNDRQAEGNIGNKNTIHHIEMKPVGLAVVDHLYVFLKIKEIGTEQRWGNEMWHHPR
jgi:hypothetical protein